MKENEEVKEIFKTASEESVGILDINRKKVEHIPSGFLNSIFLVCNIFILKEMSFHLYQKNSLFV